jgi:hypothetical protein
MQLFPLVASVDIIIGMKKVQIDCISPSLPVGLTQTITHSGFEPPSPATRTDRDQFKPVRYPMQFTQIKVPLIFFQMSL